MQHLFKTIKQRKKFNYKCGDKFGRLALTGITYTKIMHGHWVRYVEAVCICGVVKEYQFSSIACGDTQSCGCLRVDTTRRIMTTHNLSNHLLYDVHVKMIKRCYDETDESFKNYGGRGIEVWKDWKDDFVCFYDWCIANGYEEGKSLDRKENDGHYSPQNCRFVTQAEQNRNRRNNRMFTAFGESKCLFDWGKDSRCKVSVWGLRNRMDRGKWTDFELALTTPEDRLANARIKKNNRYLTAFGETKCFTAWLDDKRCLVKIDSLRDRLAKGWDAEKSMSTPPTRDGKNTKAVIAIAC